MKSLVRQTRWRRLGPGVLALLVVWVFLAPLAANHLSVAVELPHADAIAVLGGSGTYIERTRHAAQLFREGRAPKILLTNDGVRGGWSRSQQRGVFFVERAQEELRSAGVPADKIEVIPEPTINTHDEALRLRQYATTHNLKSLLVVTSAYHSRRAWWTMRKVFDGSGVEIGIDPVPPGQQAPSAKTWWLYPSGWLMVAGEYVKIVYYRLRY